MKKIIWIIIVVVILGLLIWSRNSSSPAPVSDMQPIKIGGNLALTSYGASWGENQ